MNLNDVQPPKSLEDLKALIQQFEMFLPEENRKVIWDLIDEVESTGGIQSKEQAQELMMSLVNKIGLNFENFPGKE